MPSIAWHSLEGLLKEEPAKSVRYHLGCLKIDGEQRKIDTTRVELLDPRTIRLHLSGEKWCEVSFEEEGRASALAQEIGAARAKKHGRQATGEPGGTAPYNQSHSPAPPKKGLAASPGQFRRKWAGMDEFGDVSSKNKLPAVGGFLPAGNPLPDKLARAPQPQPQHQAREEKRERDSALPAGAMHIAQEEERPPPQTPHEDEAAQLPLDAHEEKRRKIDALVGTVAGSTPEKERPRGGHIRRAAPAARTVLFLPSRSSSALQSSSSYRGYRSSENFGLRNLGNTCYLNAVMQACAALREFVADLYAMAAAVPPCQAGELYGCTVEMLQQMSSPSSAQGGPLSPAKLRERVAVASPMFGGCDQQDAHEFLLEYVNQLHDELLNAREEWLSLQGAAAPTPADSCTLATHLHLDSEVHKRLACINCGRSHDIYERFRDFSLDFQGDNRTARCTLASMMQAYFAPELLDAKCEHCSGAAALMEKTLVEPPRTLVLHLKRFVPNLQRRRYDKRHQKLDFPSRLDLQGCLHGGGSAAAAGRSGPPPSGGAGGAEPAPRLPARPLAAAWAGAEATGLEHVAGKAAAPLVKSEPWMAGSGSPASPLWYNLRAVISHDGASPHSGHYVCYARGESGAWRLYDDSTVRDLGSDYEPQRELGDKAYILFYVIEAQKASVP